MLPVRALATLVVGFAGVVFAVSDAAGSHNGPTRAEVLGLDPVVRRVYCAQFDESEVAYAPQLFYFDLAGRDRSRPRRVAGPMYLGDAGTPALERRIDSLRASLVHPAAMDTAAFRLRVRWATMPDSVLPESPDERAARYLLNGSVSCAGLRGTFRGVAFFDPDVEKVAAWRFPPLEECVFVVKWQGIWIGSADDLESCVLMTKAASPRRNDVQ